MTDKFSNVLKAKEDMQKSPEQLEKEKREILSQRIPKLNLDGKVKDDLIEIATQFHNLLNNIYSQIYDLNEKHDRQKYDMMELAERARQIEKGKSKIRKSNIVHTGLGGSVFGTLQEKFPQAPGKISLFSRYERVTDRRSYGDRREVFASEKKKEEFQPVKVKAKIKHIDEPKEEVKVQRKKREEPAAEEHHEEEAAPAEEEHHEEAPAEEEHHEEEAAPAEEEHHEEEEEAAEDE